MGKGKHRKNRDESSGSHGSQSSQTPSSVSNKRNRSSSGGSGSGSGSSIRNSASKNRNRNSGRRSFYYWCVQERRGILWVFGCALIGGLVGFGIGTGYLTGEHPQEDGITNSAWRTSLGVFMRKSLAYRNIIVREFFKDFAVSTTTITSMGTRSTTVATIEDIDYSNDPSHPRVFAVLREAVIREPGGYVHPDLGPMLPAPCGASRGLGMVSDGYHRCQINCLPGIASEKKQRRDSNETHADINGNRPEKKQLYKQVEVLLKVPLSYQMTRTLALETMLPRVPADVQRRASLHELDDAALLVLLLAHERGVGKYSRWMPYIATMPKQPSCGYSAQARPFMLDSNNALRDELGLDIYGWHEELVKAEQYADRIATALSRDYGPFLQHPKDVSSVDNLKWALCQVTSRATGGSQKHGGLRLVPVLDMVNHDANAGGFVELTGKERFDNGDFVDATEEDSGAFVIRSLRHGRRKALRKGQELLANYNVPHYSSLDWFVSLGFVPPERWSRWQKIDAALPRIRRDGPFAEEPPSTADLWKDFSLDL